MNDDNVNIHQTYEDVDDVSLEEIIGLYGGIDNVSLEEIMKSHEEDKIKYNLITDYGIRKIFKMLAEEGINRYLIPTQNSPQITKSVHMKFQC